MIETDIENPPIAAEQIHIFPNPNRNRFHIQAELEVENVNLRLYNVQGELVYTKQVKGRFSEKVSTKDLAVGVYLLEVEVDGGKVTKKVVVE